MYQRGKARTAGSFHWLPKLHHQATCTCISALAEAFRRTWWCTSLTKVDRSINRRGKVLPGLITFEVWPRWPIRDSNSLLVQAFLPCHLPSSTFKALSLSWGRRSCEATESISIPRKTKQVLGASTLCASQPSSAHVWKPVSKATWHSRSEAPPPPEKHVVNQIVDSLTYALGEHNPEYGVYHCRRKSWGLR